MMGFSKLLTAGVLVASLAGGVASADPTQNGFAGEGYGANSAGGGNRASANYGGQYAPNAVASAEPTQNGFAGESYGANSAGGGNR
jgi:hypothetical protein